MIQISTARLPLRRIHLPGLLLLLVVVGWPRLAVAQTAPDTTRVRYSEETITGPEPAPTPLGRAYSKLTRLQTEEQTLWKIGLNNFGGTASLDGPTYFRYGLHLIYERKLDPEVSVMLELSPDFTRYQQLSGAPMRRDFSVRTQVAGRYYYNLSQRIRKGKSASNFSANYLSLTVGNGFGRRSRETPFYYYSSTKPLVRADMALLYGLQRRLGPYGFVDFNVGVSTKLLPVLDDFSLAVALRIGLALGR